jgi:NADPH2:quinone reductase
MTKAVRIEQFGGPENMKLVDVEVPAPGNGEVTIRHQAISVHFADLLMRQGRYFMLPDLPATLGLEGVGVIEAVGADVADFKPGDKAGYMFDIGSYCEARTLPARGLIKIPEAIDPVWAACGLLRGLTAQYLLRQAYPVKAGDKVLVHAAAGGMGQILTRWAKHLGAQVFATAGGADKCATAKANGADYVIDYNASDFAAEIADLTGALGVNVVYDAIGKDTYEGNIACLAPLGSLVNYGHASGLLEPIDAMELNKKSLHFTKTSLTHYAAPAGARDAMARELFDLIERGVLVFQPATYALSEAAQAHKDMGLRKTTGQVVLLP